MKIKYLFFFFSFLTLSTLFYTFWQAGSPAPTITFTTITGKKIDLASLQGNPVIVTFWATDCASCIEEISHFIELYKQFHSQGLEIIAVAMYYDPPNHVVEMSKAKEIPYNVALDLKSEHAFAFGQVELTPTTFLISPSGQIIYQKTGLIDLSMMKQRINHFFKG